VRLTLRTLLAYLDDTLEPSQAKLIGQKVAESDAAQELIARIKQVARRRRLTTPPNTGPGAKLDANVMAEYLDNMLPADQLAEVEEICLASDVHLAEVAACHQILTLVLGEPALVPPTARQRMYGLIRGRESIPNRKVAGPALGPGTAEPANQQLDEADEALLLGLPLYRSGSWLRWLVPLGALVLLVAASLSIVKFLQQSNEAANREPVDLLAKVSEAKAEPELLLAPQPETIPAVKVEPAAEKKEEVASTSNKPKTENTEAPKKNDKAEPTVAVKTPRPPDASPPSTERRELGKAVLEPPCILLQQNPETGAWQRLSLQKRVSSTDKLVSLPGYRSDLRTDTGVQLQLWGNLPQFSRTPVLESVVTLHANPSVDLDFTLDHGRVLLSNHKEEGPARIRIRFRDEIWDLTLEDQTSEVAVQLFGLCQPYGKDPGGAEPEVYVGLYAVKGEAQLRVRYETHRLFSPSMIDWDSVAGGVAAQPRSLPRAPDWYTSKMPPQNHVIQDMQAALKELSQRLVAKDKIDVVVAEAMKDPINLGSRILAVRCLAAMNEVGKLLDALADGKHLDVRMVAIEELRHLLGLSAGNDALISKTLRSKNYTEGQVMTILQLLHGFNLQQWSDPTTRATAVEYLNHEKLAIRQLTHALLCSLAPEGAKIPYDATGDNDQRERAAKDWQRVVLAGKPKDEGRGTRDGRGKSKDGGKKG
jgi:hypothetical protein